MSAGSRRPREQAGATARDRLAAYRRYAELLRSQEAALAEGDVDGFHALADEAVELQRGLGTALPSPGLGVDPEQGQGPFVDEVAELLRVALGAGERIEARLRSLRAEAGTSVRRAAEGHRRVRGYGPARAPEAGGRLNVTL